MLRPGITFLNHGSFGAVPRVVSEAQAAWREKIEAEPVEILGRHCAGLIEEAKVPVAKQFGMKLSDFGFVTNATEGVNAVLRSLMLGAGDELLTTNHVYHAIRQTLRLTARRAGAELREVPIELPARSSDQIRQVIVDALSPKTRLLVIDHVTSPTGLVFPIGPIIDECRRRGVEVLVDGAHAPGMVPLNVESLGATYYAANLHKWVCAERESRFCGSAPAASAMYIRRLSVIIWMKASPASLAGRGRATLARGLQSPPPWRSWTISAGNASWTTTIGLPSGAPVSAVAL